MDQQGENNVLTIAVLHINSLQTLGYSTCHHKLDGCIVWNTHKTVFGSKHSAIFLHSTRPSVM